MQSNNVITSINLTEIRQSETLASPEKVKSIIYLIKPMDKPFSSELAKKLQKYTPESLIFDWLASLEEQNRLHQQMVDQGACSVKELSPFQIPYDLVLTIYQKLTYLLKEIENDPNITHQQLLEAISPETAKIHKEARAKNPTAKKAFSNLPKECIDDEATVVKRRESISRSRCTFFSINKAREPQNRYDGFYCWQGDGCFS